MEYIDFGRDEATMPLRSTLNSSLFCQEADQISKCTAQRDEAHNLGCYAIGPMSEGSAAASYAMVKQKYLPSRRKWWMG